MTYEQFEAIVDEIGTSDRKHELEEVFEKMKEILKTIHGVDLTEGELNRIIADVDKDKN